MKRFVQQENRNQSILFPGTLDESIEEENPVRIIDAFVESLNLIKLGFEGVNPKATGRPAYHPSVLIKIYIYGYLNRIQSSRRLEQESRRNIELIWLSGNLSPDHKTIANFRKNNADGIKNLCKEFVQICRKLKLFSDALIAIDGSKFKAVNSYDNNFSKLKVKSRLDQLQKSIDRYFGELESADRIDSRVTRKKTNLKNKINKIKKAMCQIKRIGEKLHEAPDEQISLTDPDARSMRTRSKTSGVVGYNVQTAVDAKNHIIVAHEVTNSGSDRSQLSNMALQAKEAMGLKKLTALADRGYYKGEEILACDNTGITAFVPKNYTSSNQAKGLFGKRDFKYIAKDDEYKCPAGKRAIWRMTTEDKGKIIHRYWSSACTACKMKAKCTTGKYRRISRWEHEEVLDAMQKRLDSTPGIMSLRRSVVEHPFGTLKAWMGSTHFTMRTKQKVGTEMSLHILAYNLKRAINIVGAKKLMLAIEQ